MAKTANYGWQLVDPNSQPDGPSQINAVANSADATLKAQVAALQASITAVQNAIPTVQTGSIDVTVTAANTPTTTHVTFPTPFSGGAPKVFLDPRAFFPLLNSVDATAVSSTGFDIIFERSDPGSATITVDWLAIRP